MDVSKLSDQEKSVMLARMLKEDMLPGKYMPVMSPEFKPVNLYDPANMALAWRVLNWADDAEPRSIGDRFGEWWGKYQWWVEPGIAFQRESLDKILELAIDAGLIPAEEAT